MNVEQVIQKILADAQEEASNIKKQQEAKLAAENSEFDEKLADYNRQSEELATKRAQEKKSHMLAAARMKVAKEYLAEKRQLINEVFKEAEEKIKNLPEEEYLELMSKLMINAIDTGDEEIIIDPSEKRIDQRLIKQVNRELGPGYKGNLRLSEETQEIGAGFVLKRGSIYKNASLKVLIEQAQKDLEIELANELFSD